MGLRCCSVALLAAVGAGAQLASPTPARPAPGSNCTATIAGVLTCSGAGGSTPPASASAAGTVQLAPGATTNVLAPVASTGAFADLAGKPTISNMGGSGKLADATPDTVNNSQIAFRLGTGGDSTCHAPQTGYIILCVMQSTGAIMISTNGAAYVQAFSTSTGGTTTTTPTTTATTTTLTASPTSAVTGNPVTLTAAVSPAAAAGTVTFAEGSTTLGTGTLASGSATFSTSSLAVGAHSITATYGGSSTYAASTSTASTVTINAAVAQTGAGPQYSTSCAGTTSCTVTTAAGDTIVAIGVDNSSSSLSLVDSAGTMTALQSVSKSPAGNGGVMVSAYIANATAGSHTISFAAGNYPSIVALVVHGASATAPVDASAGATYQHYGTTVNGTPVTTTGPNRLIIHAAEAINGNGALSAGTGFTQVTGIALTQYGSAATAGTITPTYSSTTSPAYAVDMTVAVK